MNVKKLISMVFALVMLLAMSATAMAANAEITVKDDRTYEVYQIFTGDLHDTTLTNVKWGVNGTGTTGEAVPQETLNKLAALSNTQVDAPKLAEIEKYVDLNSTPVATVSASKPESVATGYYLLKDVTPTLEAGEEYSEFVVEIVGPTEISGKVSNVTSEKKVKDTNDSVAGSTSDWQDSADHDIGDDVTFLLKGTVTGKYDNYSTYYYAFHDTLSAGLSFNNDVVVKVDGVKIEAGYEVVTANLEDGCTFEVRFNNLKDITDVKAGSVITVEYSAKLNSQAVIGADGNPNTMHLEYSNNPNDESDKGVTPEDTVIVFTYKVVVTKVDQDKQPLAGAKFTLKKKNAEGTYVPVGEEKVTTDVEGGNVLVWERLDDGDYILEEDAPAGYNRMKPIKFSIVAGHVEVVEEPSDIPTLESLNGNVVTGEVEFAEVEFAVDKGEGSLSTTIVNQKGATLPETGAQGTKMLYIVGGILVAAAVVLLIVKRRMDSAE